MGIKVIIFLLLSIYIQASNLDSNISKTNIEPNKPQKIEQKYVEKKQFSANSKNKTTIDETKVRDIAKDEYLKNFNQTQLSYQNAIIGTNNNIIYFEVGMGIILSLLGIAFYFSFKIEMENNKKETIKNIEDKISHFHDKIDLYLKNKLETIKDDLEKINRQKIKNLAKSEINLVINELQRLQKLSANLHYRLNQKLINDLNNKKNNVARAFSLYNSRYEKLINITSLQNEDILKALKEIKISKYRHLLSGEMRDYLKELRNYIDDDNLIKEIDNTLKLIHSLKRRNHN